VKDKNTERKPPAADDEDVNDQPARRAPGPAEERHRQPEPLQMPGEEHDDDRKDDKPSEPVKIIA
jgi:hypothetical protein